jgi:hypothetical protein
MKKYIIIISCIISVFIIGCFIYFNSSHYKYKVARELLNKRINHLDQIKRFYVYEGVYSFLYNITITNTTRDKFGVQVTTSDDVSLGEGEVSFRSDKVSIIFRGIREEIKLGYPTLGFADETYTRYSFPIIQWDAYNIISNYCFFKFDSSENKKYLNEYKLEGYKIHYDRLALLLEISKNKLNNKDVMISTIVISGLKVANFKCLSQYAIMPERIELNTLKYKYNNDVPTYVNAKYRTFEYDINLYLKRVKYAKSKNPFILK